MKRYGKCGRKLGWIVKWYGNASRIVIRYGLYGRKGSWRVKRDEKYGRNPSWKVKRFWKYRRKLWNDMENMEEK